MKRFIALIFSMLLLFGAVPVIAAACSDDGGDEGGDDGPGWLKPGQEWPAKQNTKNLEKGMGAEKGQGGNGGCDDGTSADKGKKGTGKGGKGGKGGR